MIGPGTSTVRGEDGTEILVRWAYPGADAFEWIRDRSHWPDPRTPMDLRLQEDFWTGADRAWEEVGLAEGAAAVVVPFCAKAGSAATSARIRASSQVRDFIMPPLYPQLDSFHWLLR